MAVETSAVQRAVLGMTLGTIAAHEVRKQSDWEGGMDEYDQQFQIPVNATVERSVIWAEVQVNFNVTMFNPVERDSPYTKPLFTYGWEYRTGKPVMLTAMVKSWYGGLTLGYSGATLLIGACNPNIKKPVKFSGLLHANFQGYASPDHEDESEEGDE